MKLIFDKFSPFLGGNLMEASSWSPGCFTGTLLVLWLMMRIEQPLSM